MLQEDSACDEKPFYEELGIEAVDFKKTISGYITGQP